MVLSTKSIIMIAKFLLFSLIQTTCGLVAIMEHEKNQPRLQNCVFYNWSMHSMV